MASRLLLVVGCWDYALIASALRAICPTQLGSCFTDGSPRPPSQPGIVRLIEKKIGGLWPATVGGRDFGGVDSRLLGDEQAYLGPGYPDP